MSFISLEKFLAIISSKIACPYIVSSGTLISYTLDLLILSSMSLSVSYIFHFFNLWAAL